MQENFIWYIAIEFPKHFFGNLRIVYKIEASHSGWSIRTLQRQYTYVK